MSEILVLDDPFRHVSAGSRSLFASLADMIQQNIIRAACENSVVLTERALTERKFQQLARAWKNDSLFMSSVTDMVNLPSYQDVIRMGMQVVPLLLRDLASEPNHWFVALSAITGEDPVPPQDWGDVNRMAAAWLRWGQEKGYRW